MAYSGMISENSIEANTAGTDGGGVFYSESNAPPQPRSLEIRGNLIAGNAAAGAGGGIHGSSNPVALVVGNVVIGNRAGSGGGVWSTATIRGNTFVGNHAEITGGGIYKPRWSSSATNNVVAFNSSGIYSDSSIAGFFNCVYGNTAYDYASSMPPAAQSGNISSDPRFVVPPSPGADGEWATSDDDYGDLRLQISSPCIDAGDNTAVPGGVSTDFGGRPRFVDATGTPDTGVGSPPIVDVGAYEYQATGATDFNDDGLVDMNDLATFLACGTGPAVAYDPAGLPVLGGCTLWPGPGDLIPADLDGDGDVDQEDFGFLQRCYSGTEPADPGCGM